MTASVTRIACVTNIYLCTNWYPSRQQARLPPPYECCEREPRRETQGPGAHAPPDKLFHSFPYAVERRTNVRFMLNTNKWITHITALRNYVARTGTSRVPRHHVEPTEFGDVKLGAWVSYVRHRQRKGHLTTEQASELATLPAWSWGPLPAGRTSNPDRDRQIRARFATGASLQAIANEFGLTRQRIHQIVKSDQNA